MTPRAFAMNAEYAARPRRRTHTLERFPSLGVTERKSRAPAQPVISALPWPWANGGQVPQPLAMTGNGLCAAVCLHASAMHMGRQWFCLCPWHSVCFELQERLLTEYAAGLWPLCTGSAFHLPPAVEMAPLAAGAPVEDDLARSMDIALGERAA